MNFTRWAALGAGIFALTSCAYGFHSAAAKARYGASSRPEPSYYCYDCHGFRFFDPYYDWCPGYGFLYDWRQRPRTVALYRKQYVRIRKTHRDFGRYSYPDDYRLGPRYQRPRDYDDWRREQIDRAEEAEGSPNGPKAGERRKKGSDRSRKSSREG